MGGDEFVLIYLNEDYDKFVNICEELRIRISLMKIYYENQQVGINISIGTKCGIVQNANEFENLLQLADEQLYKAKNNGKNIVFKG